MFTFSNNGSISIAEGTNWISFGNGQFTQQQIPQNSIGMDFWEFLIDYGESDSADSIDIEKVKHYIAECPVDFADPVFKMTALHLVAQFPRFSTEILDILLDAGYSIEATDKYSKTPLGNALNFKNVHIVHRLIERGANINGSTIVWAVRGGNLELIELLLKKGVDVNVETPEGLPINIALTENRLEVLKYLLAQKIQPIALNPTPGRQFTNPPLDAAVSTDKIELVDMLLDAGADINGHGSNNMTPLMRALWRRELPVIRRLLERGAKPSNLEFDELLFACRMKVPEAIEKLIELGADINKNYKGQTLAILVLAPARFDDSLHWSQTEPKEEEARAATEETLKVLAKHGVDFNKAPLEAPTKIPLLETRSLGLFKVLESLGALLTVNIEGNNMLHLLVGTTKTDILTYVLQKGVIDVNAVNNDGLTPLHLVCKQFEALLSPSPVATHMRLNTEAMIRHGARLDCKDKDGNNAIHFICSASTFNEKILTFIVKQSDVDFLKQLLSQKNNAGETPADVAKKSNNEGISLLLSGDWLGASLKGVMIYDFAKLQPEAIERLERGFECQQVDTSKYHLNTNQTSPIFTLTKDTIVNVLMLVNVTDLVSFSMVCRQFKQWSDDSLIWKAQLLHEYGIEDEAKSAKSNLATRWNAQVNMRKGIYLTKVVSLLPGGETPREIVPHMSYGLPNVLMDYASKSGMLFVSSANEPLMSFHLKVGTKQTLNVAVKKEEPLSALAVTPDNKTLLYHRKGGPLMALNLDTQQVRQLNDVTDVMTVNGDLVMVANGSAFVAYHWKTGNKMWSLDQITKSDSILLQDNVAVIGNAEEKVQFWDINTNSLIAESENKSGINFTKGKKYAVANTASSGLVECFEISTGKSLWRTSVTPNHSTFGPVFALNEELMIVVMCSRLGMSVWDILTGKLIVDHAQERNLMVLHVVTYGHLVFVAIMGESTCSVEVWDIRHVSTPLYVIPLIAKPTQMIVKDNYLLISLLNESVKVVNFNVAK